MLHGPPEIVMFKPHPTNGFRWSWAICQPEANWGEYCAGSSEDKEQASRDAFHALARVNAQLQSEDYII